MNLLQLRQDAIAIWQAGLEAVQADRLVRENLLVQNDVLVIGKNQELIINLSDIDTITVVGAGKAGAGMVRGVESAIPEELASAKRLRGWVNVPEDCVTASRWIHLHSARLPGINEPTVEGVAGTQQILKLVESLGARDLCLCLLSGGGSALLPAPAAGITLADKQRVTQVLSAAGANIAELNTVRKQLSEVKGGGLLRRCRAGWLVTLAISDVLGDPPEVIASGPTVPDTCTPEQALAVLTKYNITENDISRRVFDVLKNKLKTLPSQPANPSCQCFYFVIGNNQTAVDASVERARQLGYATLAESASSLEGLAEEVGQSLTKRAMDLANQSGKHCLVSGGEPVVRLVEEAKRGRGGRNQQLVLAATQLLWETPPQNLVLLSAGTDGEDGPTDAAGAFVDGDIIERAKQLGLRPEPFLSCNDAYHFFEPLGALLRTGPTHTNVCDLRVIVTEK